MKNHKLTKQDKINLCLNLADGFETGDIRNSGGKHTGICYHMKWTLVDCGFLEYSHPLYRYISEVLFPEFQLVFPNELDAGDFWNVSDEDRATIMYLLAYHIQG